MVMVSVLKIGKVVLSSLQIGNVCVKFAANWFHKKYELFSDQKTPQMKWNSLQHLCHEFDMNLELIWHELT